jgi:hypothetical protein
LRLSALTLTVAVVASPGIAAMAQLADDNLDALLSLRFSMAAGRSPMSDRLRKRKKESKLMSQPNRRRRNAPVSLVILVIFLAASATSLKAAEPVTVANFVRAESDTMIRANMDMLGVSIGSLVHLRDPVTPENQPVIRMNQDTL